MTIQVTLTEQEYEVFKRWRAETEAGKKFAGDLEAFKKELLGEIGLRLQGFLDERGRAMRDIDFDACRRAVKVVHTVLEKYGVKP